MTSLVPAWKRTRSRVLSGRGASASSSSVPSTSERGHQSARRAPPRRRARSASPLDALQVHRGALARRSALGTAWPCTCRPRTLACTPRGNTSTLLVDRAARPPSACR